MNCPAFWRSHCPAWSFQLIGSSCINLCLWETTQKLRRGIIDATLTVRKRFTQHVLDRGGIFRAKSFTLSGPRTPSFFGPAFIVPGIGPLVAASPLVVAIPSALEGAVTENRHTAQQPSRSAVPLRLMVCVELSRGDELLLSSRA